MEIQRSYSFPSFLTSEQKFNDFWWIFLSTIIVVLKNTQMFQLLWKNYMSIFICEKANMIISNNKTVQQFLIIWNS